MNYYLKPSPESSKFFTEGRTDGERDLANKANQKKYRQDPVYRSYLNGLVDIRRAILNPKPSIALEMEILTLTGVPREDLLKHLGLENEYVRNQFIRGKSHEIDHIVGIEFFRKHNEFAPLMHRSYNLRVLSKVANRSRKKGLYDSEAKLVILKMMKELIDFPEN